MASCNSIVQIRCGSPWAPGRIRYALVQKGIDEALADATLAELFGEHLGADVFEGWGGARDHDDHGGLDAELWAAVRRKWRSMPASTPLAARRRRLLGWLQRRGFSWDAAARYARRAEEDGGNSTTTLQ